MYELNFDGRVFEFDQQGDFLLCSVLSEIENNRDARHLENLGTIKIRELDYYDEHYIPVYHEYNYEYSASDIKFIMNELIQVGRQLGNSNLDRHYNLSTYNFSNERLNHKTYDRAKGKLGAIFDYSKLELTSGQNFVLKALNKVAEHNSLEAKDVSTEIIAAISGLNFYQHAVCASGFYTNPEMNKSVLGQFLNFATYYGNMQPKSTNTARRLVMG